MVFTGCVWCSGISDHSDDCPTLTASPAEIHRTPDPGFAMSVAKVIDEAEELLLRKHEDYSSSNISRSPGGALNGLRVRMWDKYARANNLIDKGGEANFESLEDTFLDMLCYSCIAIMVLRGEWPDQ